MNIKYLICGFVFFLSTSTFASPNAFTVRSVPLLSTPSLSGSVISNLNKGTNLQILQRQGGWYQVKVPAGTGWIKMIAVRLKRPAAAETALGTIQYRSNTTLTTGVRGLDEVKWVSGGQGLSLQQLEQYKVTTEQAEAFAKRGSLSARGVDYVQE